MKMESRQVYLRSPKMKGPNTLERGPIWSHLEAKRAHLDGTLNQGLDGLPISGAAFSYSLSLSLSLSMTFAYIYVLPVQLLCVVIHLEPALWQFTNLSEQPEHPLVV